MPGSIRAVKQRTDAWKRLPLRKGPAQQGQHLPNEPGLPARERRLADLIDQAYSQISYDELVRVAETANWERFDRHVLDVLAPYQEPFAAVFLEQIDDAGVYATKQMVSYLVSEYKAIGKAADATPPSKIVALTTFDRVSPTATKAAKTQAGTLVTNMVASQREAIRSAVTRAYTEGRTPQTLASDLFKILNEVEPSGEATKLLAKEYAVNANGLTQRYEQAVINRMKQTAERVTKQGITGTKALELVRKDADKYANKLRRSRSRTISRTELLRANNQGSLESFQQAIDKGIVNEQHARKQWSTSRFDVCPICTNAQGQLQPINKPFEVGTTKVMTPPGHPNCRCSMNFVTNVKLHQPPQPTGAGIPGSPAGFKFPGRTQLGEELSAQPLNVTIGNADIPNPDVLLPTAPPSSTVKELTRDEIETMWLDTRNSGLTLEAQPQYEEAIVNYTNGSGWFGNINNELRTPGYIEKYSVSAKAAEREMAQFRQYVDSLDEVMMKAPPTKKAMVTYRGVKANDYTEELLSLKPGDTFLEPGFSSTSFTRGTAERFAREDGVILEVISPQGTRGIMPLAYRTTPKAEFFDPSRELEYLLPRGTKFKVISKDGNKLVVQVVEQTTPKPATVVDGLSEFRLTRDRLVEDAASAGKLGGQNPKRVFTDVKTGEQYIFKPQPKWQADLETQASKFMEPAYDKPEFKVAKVRTVTIDGQTGSLQKVLAKDGKISEVRQMFKGTFDATKLSEAQVQELQKSQFIDYILSNNDAHQDQFIRWAGDASQLPIGIDKGQAFKHISKPGDMTSIFSGFPKMDVYNPNNNPVARAPYTRLWQQFFNNENVKITRPNDPALIKFLDRLKQNFTAESRAAWDAVGEQMIAAGRLAPGTKLGSIIQQRIDNLYNFADSMDSYVQQALALRLAEENAAAARAAQQAAAALQGASENAALNEVRNRTYTKRGSGWWALKQNQVAERLTDAETKAVKSYTGSVFRDVNAALQDVHRGGRQSAITLPDGRAKEITEQLDKVFTKASLPDDVIVYRNTYSVTELVGENIVRYGERDLDQLVGRVIVQDGFTSTSVDGKAFNSYPVKMIIRAPKGTRGLYIKSLSTVKSEEEVLLDRGYRMLVTNVRKVKKPGVSSFTYEVEATVIPDEIQIAGIPTYKKPPLTK